MLRKLGRANIYEDYYADDRGRLFKGVDHKNLVPCDVREAIREIEGNIAFNRNQAQKSFYGSHLNCRAQVYTKNALLDEQLLEKIIAL